MARIEWDNIGERYYETGVEQCALFVYDKHAVDKTRRYHTAVPWNGLISVTEKPSGAEPTDLYANDAKYGTLISTEKFAAALEAYTYPRAFAECDGFAVLGDGTYIGQQGRKTFGLAYKSLIGNDEDATDHAYKLHIIYGCLAAPSEKARKTIGDSPEANTFSWEISTTPVAVSIPGFRFKPTAYIELDSRDFLAEDKKYRLQLIENIIYGKEEFMNSKEVDTYLPLPDELYTILLTNLQLESIRIAARPRKTIYHIGEPLEEDGMVVVAKYGEDLEVMINSYVVTGYDPYTAGVQTITIHFEDKSATFDVEVLDTREIEHVSINTPPTKTTYQLNEQLDTTGLTLKVTYVDGTEEVVSSGFTCSGFDSSTPGEKEVAVDYRAFYTEFTVMVLDKTVTSIDIATPPTKTQYIVGEQLDTTGLSLNVHYSDGSTDTVSTGFSCSGFDSSVPGPVTVTVMYMDKSTTFDVTITAKTLDRIDIQTPPRKTTYAVGEQLDTSGLTLKATYNDGSTNTISEGYTCTGFDSSVAGPVTVTVKYQEKTTTFSVTITE